MNKVKDIPRALTVLKAMNKYRSENPVLPIHSFTVDESVQYMRSLEKSELIQSFYVVPSAYGGNLNYRITPLGKRWLDELIVWHIAFEGHPGGDWWAVLRSDQHNLKGKVHGGFYRLKDARKISLDGKLHMGKFPLDGYIPTEYHSKQDIVFDSYFYADTLRWFVSLGDGS